MPAMPPDPLSALAVKYGSDKWSAKHSYTAWYYETFKDRRQSVRKVVEIGVGEGASLRMWREFFPNAMIYGADIDPKRLFSEERIITMSANQAHPLAMVLLLGMTGPDVDLFIDDGSHNPFDQVMTYSQVIELLTPGFTYVIEDVARLDTLTGVGPDYSMEFPVLEHRNRYDNRLVVIRHA